MEGFVIVGFITLLAVWLYSRNQKTPPPNTGKNEATPKSTPTPMSSTSAAVPYHLKINELPQGTYLIGRDIPAGTYDFFVVYGDGGKFDICKRDESGKIIDGTWTFYWVGLKETYEKRELIHVLCNEGYTIEISGSVILRIAKSQNVKINL